jgi:hypothetical protein
MEKHTGIAEYWRNLPGSIKALHVFAFIVLVAVALMFFVVPAFLFLFTLIGLI